MTTDLSNLVFTIDPEDLTFDLFIDNRWIGMSHGKTPQDARAMVVQSLGEETSKKVLMLPFYGLKTTQATFLALTGKTLI